MTFTSFGTYLPHPGICPDAESRARKDDEARTVSARLRDLPSIVQAWRDVVPTVDALAVMGVVYRDFANANFAGVVVNPADLAERLNMPVDEARRHLATLIRAGAVEERHQLPGPTLYRVNLTPPALLRRRDPVAEVSAAVARINGDLERMKADLFGSPISRGDHTSPDAVADLHARIGIRRRD
ncbi:MAG: hypothetical protein WCH83_06665 [Alphaproteobacteria bacterium]